MRLKFTFLTGDVNWLDYGGKWISKKFNNGEFDYWLVREICNMDTDDYKYYVSISVVAPSQLPQKEIDSAHKGFCCEKPWVELSDEEKVMIISDYMGGVTIATATGNNYRKLFKEVSEEAFIMNNLFGFTMDRIYNALGATGWDLLQGNSWGSLR